MFMSGPHDRPIQFLRPTVRVMNADAEVMRDLGGPISREQSDQKRDGYAAAYHRLGFCRWAVESADGRFLGYAGIMPSSPDHPLGNHFEIGWRLVRSAWGTDMLLRRRGQHSETPSRMLG